MRNLLKDLLALQTYMGEFLQEKGKQDDTEYYISQGAGAAFRTELEDDESAYTDTVTRYKLNTEERLLLLLAVLPHILPSYLHMLVKGYRLRSGQQKDDASQVLLNNHLPTVELALFILADFNLVERVRCKKYLEHNNKLLSNGILSLVSTEQDTPLLNKGLQVNGNLLYAILESVAPPPESGIDFPAHKLHTKLSWEDLILDERVHGQLQQIIRWQKHKHTVLQEWGMEKVIKPGYRSLFYGPPGTGKTLSASLIGKQLGMDVYRIDLSLVVSKYIGETEKNLSKLFSRAEHTNWILFFDEADALFGSRTNVNNSNDRYANQETSYLLQRIEDFNGIVILASNLKSNMDAAFIRRFQSVVEFKMPSPPQREQLWRSLFSQKLTLADDVDMQRISGKYEMSGGSILNVVQYCSLMAAQRSENVITADDMTRGIKLEFDKQGKHI